MLLHFISTKNVTNITNRFHFNEKNIDEVRNDIKIKNGIDLTQTKKNKKSKISSNSTDCSKLGDHAKKHFVETGHCYFFDVSKNSVWDYSSNIHIHKLINVKNEKEEVKKMYDSHIHDIGKNEVLDKRNILLYIYEFNQLLIALMDSQRDNFLSCIKDLKYNFVNIYKKNSSDTNKMLEEIQIVKNRNAELKKNLQNKIKKLHEKVLLNETLKSQLKKLEYLNDLLCETKKKNILQKENKRKEKKNIIKKKQETVQDLKQQIMDINFHIQAAAKMSNISGVDNSLVLVGEKYTQKKSRRK